MKLLKEEARKEVIREMNFARFGETGEERNHGESENQRKSKRVSTVVEEDIVSPMPVPTLTAKRRLSAFWGKRDKGRA